MRILIMGAGKMGAFLCDALSFQHEIAVYDVDAQRLRFVYNTYRFTSLDEIRDFRPELLINAVTVKYTIEAFVKELQSASYSPCSLTTPRRVAYTFSASSLNTGPDTELP